MPNHRRNRVPGGTYFFTDTLRNRRSDLLTARFDHLRAARTRRPFHIDGWVVLPDHIHWLWTLPPGDTDYSRHVGWISEASSTDATRRRALSLRL